MLIGIATRQQVLVSESDTYGGVCVRLHGLERPVDEPVLRFWQKNLVIYMVLYVMNTSILVS